MADDLAGNRLGIYDVQAKIGRGGMGTVYLGYDPLLDRRVAIKVLAPHLVWEEGFVERFMREARTAARLKHPHIVTIYDVGQDGQHYYFVMEYVEGQTLSALISQYGPPPPDQVIALLRPLAAALDYAHGQGLIHRDVKPANVIVGPDGHVTLTDFGIARAVQEARLTTTGTLMGTPEYMSPEQVQGAQVDARTDQYSLAVVAYETLSGQTPFGSTTPHGVLYKQVFESPPPICRLRPGLPPGVEAVLERALAKAPDGRYATGTEFVEALSQALAGAVQATVPAPAASDLTPILLSEGKQGLQPVVGGTEPVAAQPAGMGTIPAAPLTPAAPAPTGPAPGPAARRRRLTPAWVVGGLVVLVAISLAVLVGLAALGGAGRAPGGGITATSQAIGLVPTRPTATVQVLSATPARVAPTPVPPTAVPTRVPATAVPMPVFECRDPLGCVTIRPGAPIRIGYMLVESGPDSALGIDSRRAVEIAIADRREVLGHTIELVGQDSKCSVDGARSAARKIAADPQLVAVVGPSCSSEARAAIPIVCQAGLALISPSSTAPDLTGSSRPASYFCFLRTAHNDVAQATAASHFAWEVLKARKAATLHDGSPYSESLQQMFADRFKKLGGTITGQEVVSATAGDVPQAVERALAGRPDVLFCPLFVEAGAAVVRSVPEIQTVILADAVFSAEFLAAAGPALVGRFYSSPDFSRFGPAYDELRKKYVDRYGQEPTAAYHAHAYDATIMILAAIERVAVSEPDGTLHIARRALLEALYATRGLAGMSGNLSCSPDGDCAGSQIAVYEVVNADPASWKPGPDGDSNPRRIWP
jgi:ABC-type branched-subunit amino acid transport system substrate-binding protein